MTPRWFQGILPLSLCLFILLLFVIPATPPVQGQLFATNTPQGKAANDAMVVQTTPTPLPLTTPQPVATVEPDEPVTLAYPAECAYVPGQPTSQACIAFMEAYAGPPITAINRDGYTLSQYSFWRVGPQAVNTYDAPGGGVVGQIPAGFNFVNAVNQVEGWIQSEDGAWIPMTNARYVPASNFRGVTLEAQRWQLPFAWILDTTGIYASKYPGGPSDSATGLVPLHYEIFTIFAEAQAADGVTWYLVGSDQWVVQFHMTVIKPVDRPAGIEGRWVAVDLYEQSMVAYEGDRPVFATLISTGLPGTETNEGVFEIWARLARDGMSGATGAPNAYALQSVPWVQYFDGGISLHGTYWHDTFGYRRSRGCVNLSISDARWAYDFLGPDEAGETGMVYVHSSGVYGNPGA